MKSVEISEDSCCVMLKYREMLIINSALNEICNGIDLPEFETRVGAEKLEVEELLESIGSVIDRMK